MQAIGIDHCMNLAGQPAATPAHELTPKAEDASGVLLHAYNRRVDHLESGILGACQCIRDPLPDACPTRANEAVVANGLRTERLRQVESWGRGSRDPIDAIEDMAIIHPWNTTRLIRKERFDGRLLKIGKFAAHDSRLQFGSLNQALGAIINPPRPSR